MKNKGILWLMGFRTPTKPAIAWRWVFGGAATLIVVVAYSWAVATFSPPTARDITFAQFMANYIVHSIESII